MTDIELPSERAPATTNKQKIKQELQTYRQNFRSLLERTDVSEVEFAAMVTNAVRDTKGLVNCAPTTIIGAALRCAQLGLAPNDGRNLAWIIPRGQQASFQLGYGGVMELARRAVPGIKFEGRAVYEADEFSIDYGSERPLTHKPSYATSKGQAYAWYVLVTFPDGSQQVHHLDREGVEYHRAASQMKNSGMWRDNYDAAALKSVVMDMKRWLPSEVWSPQLQSAVASDGATFDVREMEDDVIEVESDEVTA
jgi:recombination protein RecT